MAEPQRGPEGSGRGPVGASGRDPNYILSQEEFHQAIRPLYQMHGETQGQIASTVSEIENTFGWLLLGFCFWCLLIARYALKGQLRQHG